MLEVLPVSLRSFEVGKIALMLLKVELRGKSVLKPGLDSNGIADNVIRIIIVKALISKPLKSNRAPCPCQSRCLQVS